MSVDLSSSVSSSAFTQAELDSLRVLNVATLMRSSSMLRVLISRLLATVAAEENKVLQASRDLDRFRALSSRSSNPMALAAEALANLTPNEQTQVLSPQVTALIEQLKEATLDAFNAQMVASSRDNRLRLKVAYLLDDDEVDEKVKDQLREVLEELPLPEPPVVNIEVKLPNGVAQEDSLDNVFN